ncbi:MAG TPA: hypothetical protein DIT04_09530 [Dysgonomonas sp.]|nr:hypothetical protein [Dysgonomonas sp.]
MFAVLKDQAYIHIQEFFIPQPEDKSFGFFRNNIAAQIKQDCSQCWSFHIWQDKADELPANTIEYIEGDRYNKYVIIWISNRTYIIKMNVPYDDRMKYLDIWNDFKWTIKIRK